MPTHCRLRGHKQDKQHLCSVSDALEKGDFDTTYRLALLLNCECCLFMSVFGHLELKERKMLIFSWSQCGSVSKRFWKINNNIDNNEKNVISFTPFSCLTSFVAAMTCRGFLQVRLMIIRIKRKLYGNQTELRGRKCHTLAASHQHMRSNRQPCYMIQKEWDNGKAPGVRQDFLLSYNSPPPAASQSFRALLLETQSQIPSHCSSLLCRFNRKRKKERLCDLMGVWSEGGRAQRVQVGFKPQTPGLQGMHANHLAKGKWSACRINWRIVIINCKTSMQTTSLLVQRWEKFLLLTTAVDNL